MTRYGLLSALLAVVLVAADSAGEYFTHSKVPVLVNTVGPFNNPAERYRFYDLPFCAPKEEKDHPHTVGEVLAGDRMAHSLYDVRFKVDVQWQALCRFTLLKDEASSFIQAINNHYIFDLQVDDLQVKGFVGEVETVNVVNEIHKHSDTSTYLFTHLDFSIAYNENNVIAVNLTTDPEQRVKLVEGEEVDVEFSFGIHWHHVTTPYAERMTLHSKHIYEEQPVEIHWLSIINSCVLVVLLVAFLAVIFMRILRRDFSRYMDIDEEDMGEEEDSGWKLVHGDVFRFPANPMLLAACVGTGCQLLIMATFVILLAMWGLFHPGQKGAIYTAGVVVYALTAGIAGYVSTSLYVQLGGEKWATSAVVTASVFSLPFFVNFCVVNTLAIAYGSSSALPFGTILVMFFIWGLVTIPLTIYGSMKGRAVGPYEAPCKTNRAAREIPPLPLYRSSYALLPFSGFLPFSAIYIELHYIFASVWGHKVYTMFEILAVAFVLLLMVTAAIAVAMTYFQLASEDHQWWWRSFIAGSSTGVFIFMYAIFYFYHRSDMSGTLQSFYFFGYVSLLSYAFALMLGAVSFIVSHRFVRHIYSSIKID